MLPLQPGIPGSPNRPSRPGFPGAPGLPGNPGAPGSPRIPLGPMAPVSPVKPLSPRRPVGPRGPRSPGAPSVPDEPGRPGWPTAPFSPLHRHGGIEHPLHAAASAPDGRCSSRTSVRPSADAAAVSRGGAPLSLPGGLGMVSRACWLSRLPPPCAGPVAFLLGDRVFSERTRRVCVLAAHYRAAAALAAPL